MPGIVGLVLTVHAPFQPSINVLPADSKDPPFIDWRGIHFDGQHSAHPHVMGDVLLVNPTGPGWADPETGTFDDTRLRGRDGRPVPDASRRDLDCLVRQEHGVTDQEHAQT